MAYRSDQTLPKQGVYSREYQTRHEERTTRISSSSGRSTPTFGMSPSREINPTLKWNEYLSLSQKLMRWLRDAILDLSRRDFPQTLSEMKDVAQDFERFRIKDVAQKSQERYLITNIFDDLQNMRQFPIKAEQHINEVNKLWNEFVMALQERDSAIHIELTRIQKMDNLNEKVRWECNKCQDLLDSMEAKMMALKKWGYSSKSALTNLKQLQSSIEESFQVLFSDLQKLQQGGHQDLSQMAKNIQTLRKRYTKNRDALMSYMESGNSSDTSLHETSAGFLSKQLQDCFQWLKEKERDMEKAGYGSDLRSSFDSLELQKKWQQNIKEFQSSIQECINAKKNIPHAQHSLYNKQLSQLELLYIQLQSTSNFRLANLRSLVSFLKDISSELEWMKEKEGQASDSVSSAEFPAEELDKFYGFGTELNGRNDKHASLLERGDNLMRDQHPASNTIQFFCNLLQVQKAWLTQLSHCMEVHIRNIKSYKQFHSELAEADRWLMKQLNLIDELSEKQVLNADEAQRIVDVFKELKKTTQLYGEVIDAVDRQSTDIPTININSKSLPPNSLIRALCSYKLSNFSVSEGEMCTLVSNSLSSKWKVRNSAGLEGILPSLCFVICSPGEETSASVSRLRKNYVKLTDKMESVLSRMYKCLAGHLIQEIKSLNALQYQEMPLEERSLLRKNLNESNNYLMNNVRDSHTYESFRRDFNVCQQTLDDFDHRVNLTYSKPNKSVILLNEFGKLLQTIDTLEHETSLSSQTSFYPSGEKLELAKKQLIVIEAKLSEIKDNLEIGKQKYNSMNPSQRTATIEDMFIKLQEKFHVVSQMQKTLSKRLELTTEFMLRKSKADKFMRDLDDSVAKYSSLSSNLSQVDEIRSHFQKLKSEFLQNHDLLDNLEMTAKSLKQLSSKPHSTGALLYTDSQCISKDLSSIKSRWDELQQKIIQRKLGVDQAYENLITYKTEEGKVDNALSDYENSFNNISQDPTMDLVKSTENLISLFKNVKSFRFKMESLNKCSGLFLKEARIYENEVEQLKKNLERVVMHDSSSRESIAEEMKSLNDRYAFLLEALKANLSSRKPILEKLKCSFVLDSERESAPSFRTYQSEMDTFQPSNSFEVPSTMENLFQAENSWSQLNRLTSTEEKSLYQTPTQSFQGMTDVMPVGARETTPQEEHMHSEDMEEFFQPIKDGGEKITKHTKQEFHSRKTASGFESVSTHEKKLLSLVSTEASAYSGKIRFPLELSRAIQYCLLDPDSGIFTHPETNEQMSLRDALQMNFLEDAFFICPTSLKCYLLKDAFKLKLLDPHGFFSSLDGVTNFKQLIKDNFVKLKSDKEEKVCESNQHKEKAKDLSTPSTPAEKVYFAISSVIDPTTKKILDAFSGVQRGILDQANALYNGKDFDGNVVKIPIRDAIRLGLVFADESPYAGEMQKNKLIRETKIFTLTGVVDPITRKKLTLIEAVNSGYLDQLKGLFINPIKKVSMPITEAISLGHVLADVKISNVNDDDVDESSLKKILTSKEVALTISSVVNPFNGKELSASDAIKMGIFDPSAGVYNNLKSNETLTLSEAIDKQLIKVIQGRPKEKDIPREEKVASLHIDDEMDAREEMAHEEIVEERKTFQITGVKEPKTGKYISFSDAVTCRLINEERGLYCDYITNQNFTIPEALERGLIIGTTHTVDQQELFKSAIVAQKREDILGVYNPITGDMVSVNEALQLGLLNKDMTLYFDPANNDVLKIDLAIYKGYVQSREKPGLRNSNDSSDESVVTRDTKVTIDWSGGRVLNRVTKEEIQISKALEFGLIEDYIASILKMKNPNKKIELKVEENKEIDSVSLKMVVQVTYLRDESGRIIIEDETPTRTEMCSDEGEGYSGMSFYDAVILGLFDIRKGVYFDPFSTKSLTLREAIEAGSINPLQPALMDISNGKKFSLNALIDDGTISILTGTISLSKLLNRDVTLDPNYLNFLSHTVNLEDAIRCGLFNDEKGFFQLPFSKKTFDLETAIKNNLISGEANIVLNPLTGERLLLNKAIESKVINGQTGKFSDSTLEKNITLSRAIILGLIKQRYQDKCSVVMDFQSGELSALEECIDSNIVDQNIPCVYDASTKNRISLLTATSLGLVNKSKKTFNDCIIHSELSLSDAAKVGLICFTGAPILANTECITSDVIQSSLQTNVSLLKGARLQENITDSFGDIPPFTEKDFVSSKPKKLSDTSTEVSFVKNEPNKKTFETKTFDTNTDETPAFIEIAKDGRSLIATQRVIDKVQKLQIKETLEDVSESDPYSKLPSTFLEDLNDPIQKRDVTIKSDPYQEECTYVASLSKAPTTQIYKNTYECKVASNDFQKNLEPNAITNNYDFECAINAPQKTFKSSVFQPVISSPSSKHVDKEGKKNFGPAKELIHIDWKTGKIIDLSKNVLMTSAEAFERGFIDAHIKELLDKALAKILQTDSSQITLNDALDKGLLIVPLSKVRNSITNQNLTIEEAVAVNYIDLDRSVIIDPLDMKPKSLTELVERQVFNIENAVMKNSTSGKIMTLSEIIQLKLIPKRGLPNVTDLRVLSFGEALDKGLLDENTNQFTEKTSGCVINLETALRIGYLRHDPTDNISLRIKEHKYPTPLTLLEAVKSGILSLETFLYSNPYSDEKLSMADAISKGLILVPELDRTSEVEGIDFETAYKRGYLDVLENIFIDPITGVLVPLDAAIKKGYVILPGCCLNPKVTEVDEETANLRLQKVYYTRYLGFPDLPLEFGDALICGLYDEVSGTFSDPYESGSLTLEEAVQYNLIKLTSKVKDPVSGKWISLLEAMREGHIDPASGKFVDLSTFSAIPLKEAEELGMFHSIGPCLWMGNFQNSDVLSSGSVSFKILQVLDPIRKHWISPEEGIKLGYLSIYNDMYVDPSLNARMSLFEAMTLNKIKVEAFDSRMMPSCERKFNIKSVIDHMSKQEISPNAAEQKKILDMNDKTYSNFYDKSKISLHEAHLLNLIKVDEVGLQGVQELKPEDVRGVMDYTTGENLTLSEAVDNNLIDGSMSYYIDPRTSQKLTLYEAWQQGHIFLNADKFSSTKSKMIKSVIDPRTGEEIPISDAIRHQIVDKAHNRYWNMKTNTFMDLDHAIEKGLVLTESSEEAVRKPAVVEVDDHQDSVAKVYVIKSVCDPSSRNEYDPVEAEKRGYINKIRGIYMNPLTGKQISIKQAIDQGYVCASKVDVPDYDELMKNDDAYAVLECNKSIKEINSVIDPITNEKISLLEGIRRGFIDLNSSSIIGHSKQFLPVRDTSNRNLSLSSLSHSSNAHDPDFDDDDYSFKVIEPYSFTLPRTTQDSKLDERVTVKAAISKGLIDQNKEMFFDPISCQTMSILEGLNSGKLIVDCPTKINNQPETFSSTSKKVTPVDLSGEMVKSFNKKLLRNDAKVSQSKCSFDGKESSHSSSHWKDGFNMQARNHQSFSNDDRSSVSKEDLESLDQLLAELEHGRGDDTKFQNHLQIDDSVLMPNLKQEKDVSDKVCYSYERGGFSSLTSSKQTSGLNADQKVTLKNESSLNDSLSDLLSENLSEELVVKENAHFDSLNLDSEKASTVGGCASVTSTSDLGREQIFTMDELVKLNLYDRSSGLIHSPETGKELPLLEAIERGIVQKNSVRLCDPSSGKLITLAEAFERGIMDAENGNLTDVYTGKVLRFSESVNKALELKSTPLETSVETAARQEGLALCTALEKNYFDSEARCFKFPGNSKNFTLKEAVENGFIKTRSTAIRDIDFGHKIFLDTLIALGLVDQERGLFRDTQGCFVAIEKAFQDKVLIDCDISPKPYSLKVLLEDGLYSRDSNSFFDPDTKQFVSLKDAIDRNLLDPNSVLCINHSSNNEIVSLNEALSCKFIGSDTGKNSLTLSAALDKGVALKKPITLSKAIEIGLLNETTGKFLDPIHRKFFTLKEALESGFISYDSVIADPSSRNLISLSDAISSGVVDPHLGTVTNIHTQETFSLREACTSAKLVKKKISCESSGDQNVLTDEGVETRKCPQSSSENPSQIALNNTDAFLSKLFKRDISLEEALKTGLIDQDSCMIGLPWSDEILSMRNVIERNLIDLKSGVIMKPGNSELRTFPDVVLRESIDCNSNNFSLAEALYLEIYNPETGVVTDPNCGRKMSLFESLKSNFISYQKTVLIVDGKIVNLLEAVLNELVDPKKGEVKDIKSGQMISFIGAIERELILDAYMPPKFSFEQMCKMGLYDRVVGRFVNPFNKKHVSLAECLFGLEMLDANKCFTFLPDSKKHIPLMLAFNQKLLSSDCNFVTDPSTRKQYPVIEALDGSLESKRASHPVKRDDEVRNLGLLSQKLHIYKDWLSEAYQQIGTCQVTANKDDLGRELRRLQNFSAMIQEVKPDMASLQNQMEKVLSDSSHYHDKTKLEKLKTLNHGVKSQYNLLLENVRNQIKLLTSCQEELIKYEDEKQKFVTWLSTAIDELDSKFSNFKYIREVGNQKEVLKNYVDEVFIRQGDLKYVEICKNQFLDQAQHFDALQLKSKNLKRSSSHMDLLYSMIDDLRQLTNEYNMLRANSRAQLDRVEALSDCLKRVEDIERQVKNSLDEIEQNAEYLSKHRSKDKLRNDLTKQLKSCSSELQSQCLFFEKLKTIVNDLIRQLNQFGSTESLQKEIKDKVIFLEERLRQVDGLLKAKSAELESFSFSNQSVADEVKELSSLVGSVECLVDEMDKKMILDEDLMIGRIKDMKTLGQEISVLQQPLSQLMHATATISSGAAIKQLHKRYRDVAAKFQRKEDELEEAVAFLSGFNSNTKQLKIWMNDILGHLEVKDTSVKELKEIHESIIQRSGEFTRMRTNVEDYLLGLDVVGGKEKLKEMIEEIQTGLTEIETLCLSRISQEEKKEELETTFKRLKDKIILWIEDKENMLNSDDKSAFRDMESLDECIEDFQSFKDYVDELNDTCLNICELLTECDRVSSAYQRLRRCFRKGVRSPSPISFAMKHFDFEEVSGEHQRTAMELTSKYEIIGERLESERKELIENLDLLEQIRRDCENFSKWLEKKEETFRSTSLSSDEVSQLKSCRSELLKKESSINNLKSRLQQLPQSLEKTSALSNAVDNLVQRWKVVENSSAKLLESCSEQADDVALLKSLYSQLSSWLSMKEKVIAMCLGLLGVDCDVLENQSIQVELLKEEMKSEQDGYQLFMNKGHKIVEHSGSEETYVYMEEISSRWNKVQTKLAEKEAAIARLLSACTPFYKNLNSLSESLSACTKLSSELLQSPNLGRISHWDMRSKEESLESQKVHMRNLLEAIKQSASDLHDLSNDSNSQLKIQNRVMAAEKSFKDFLRSSDLVHKHLASKKAEEQKAMSNLGKALTWMDGILKNVASLEETSLEPSTILSLHQIFQTLKENFETKENNIVALIRTSQDLSAMTDCEDFNLRLNEVCCKFKEVRNKIVLMEPKVKLISEKANQCIADIDKLSLWLELTNSKFLSSKLNFNSKNLVSKMNDALYLKSEFDMYSVDLEMVRNIINELNSASAGAGLNMEHILVGLENVWNDSRKENEARLQILEESQEKLDEFKDLQEELGSRIQERENMVSQHSMHSETLEVDSDENVERSREILSELSNDGFFDAHELQSFEETFEEMLKRKNEIQEKLLELRREHELTLNNAEELLKEVDVIAEDQTILEDCISMNSKNSHDLPKLKQQSEYLEVFKKQNEVIGDKICVIQKNLMNLASEKLLTNIDLIQAKVKELREQSNRTLFQLGEQQNIIKDSTSKLENLDAMCTSTLKALTDASEMLGSLECNGSSFTLEQMQSNLKDLQDNVLDQVHSDLEAIKTQKHFLVKISPIPISDSSLDSKIVKLNDLWTGLNRKMAEEEQKLHKAFLERGNFSEALSNYSSQLLCIKKEVDACDKTSLDQSYIQRQIQALKDAQDKLRAWKNDIESAEDMLSLQLNKSNEESLLNKIKLLNDSWTDLCAKTQKTKESLNELQDVLTAYHQKLNSFHQWLEIVEDKVLVDMESIDIETSISAMDELQLLSEEVNHYISALSEFYEISTKISDITSDEEVSTALNKNLSGLSSRLKNVAMKLNASKEKLTRGTKLMEDFFETHHNMANLLDGLEGQEEIFTSQKDLENFEELSAAFELKLETLKNLLQELRGFLSLKAIHEYSEIVSHEQARCEKITSQIKSKSETFKAKQDESEKLQEEVEELLRLVHELKGILSSPLKPSIDPLSLKNQLMQQKNLHDKVLSLKSKSRNIVSTVRRQSRIFEVDSALDENIGKLTRDIDSCFKMSTSKVHVLEQTQPLAVQFHETMNEIKRFLDEFAMSYKSLDHSLASLQPIRQRQDDFKALRQKLVDQRFLLDRFNKTALALMRFLGTENKEEFEAVINEVNGKFSGAKVSCQNKINELDQAFYESAQMSDKIDELSEMFESTLVEIEITDSIPCSTEKLLEHIEDIRAVKENMESKKETVEFLRAASLDFSEQVQQGMTPSPHGSQELVEKAKHMADVYHSVMDEVDRKKKLLEKVLKSLQKFWNSQASISSEARKLEEYLEQNFNSFNETPPSNTQSLAEHSSAIQSAEETIENLFHKISDLKHAGDELSSKVDEADRLEILSTLEGLQDQLTDLRHFQVSISTEVDSQLKDLSFLKSRLDENLECLEDSEQQLSDFNESSSDAKMAEQFLQNLYEKGCLKLSEVHGLKNRLKDFIKKRKSGSAPLLMAQVKELKSKWMQLTNDISKRIDLNLQSVLSNDSSKLEAILEDLYKWSDDKAESIESLPKPIKGCTLQISSIQNQLEMHKADINNHQPSIRIISNALNESSRTDKKLKQMSQRMASIKNNMDQSLSKIRIKQVDIDRLLEEAKGIDEHLEAMSEELDRINNVARTHSNIYSRPSASIQQQHQELQSQAKSFGDMEPRIDILLASQSYEVRHSKDVSVASLRKAIDSIGSKKKITCKNLDKWKEKLSNASEVYKTFDKNHATFTEWLAGFDGRVKECIPVRTSADGCQSKISLLQSLKKELSDKKSELKRLEILALELKNASSKTEALIIRQMMERMWQSFRNSQLKVAKLLSLHNKALKAATALERNCSKFVGHLNVMEQQLMERQSLNQMNNIETIKHQLKDHQNFQQQLCKMQSHYDLILSFFKSLLDKSSSEDQQIHNEDLLLIKNLWNHLCQKSAEWQQKLEESLMKRAELRERVEALIEWLSKAEPQLSDQQNLCGNLDFVTELEEEHNVFLEELSLRTSVMDTIEELYKNTLLGRNAGDNNNNSEKQADISGGSDLIQAEILELKHKWNVVHSLAATKSEQIRLSLQKAKAFDTKAEELMTWLESSEEAVEMLLPLLSEDEEILQQHLLQIEDMEKIILEGKPEVEKFLELTNEVLMQAHPDVLQDLTLWLKNFQNRCEVLNEQLSSKKSSLVSTLDEVRKGEQELEDLISWLLETEKKLRADDEQPVVENLPIVEQLFQDFELLEAELQGKQTMFDKLMKSGRIHGGSSSVWKREVSSKHLHGRGGRGTPERKFKNDRVSFLNDKWKQVWVLMMDRRRKLQDATDRLNKMEQLKNFDPDEWMEKFFKWMNNNFSRVINLFRKYDRKFTGKIKRSDFIQGILNSNFTTPAVEAEIVADLFDEDGFIDYKQFASNMQSSIVEESDTVKIKNEIERLSQKCCCQRKYLIVKHSEGKYKFGLSEKLRLVRIQRSCVMVRVGGGWVTLEEFLLKNDPCRAKRKVSPDCREKFVLAEGVSQAMAPFKPKSPHFKSPHRHVSTSDLGQKVIQKICQPSRGSRSASSTPDPI